MKKFILFFLVSCLAMGIAKAQTYNWKNVRVGGCGSVTSIKAHPLVQNLYFITTDVGNPYRWNNTTQSWEGLLNNVPMSSSNVGACGNLAFDPGDATGNVLYATVGKYDDSIIGKVIKSTDRGTTWADANLSIWVGSNYDQESGERIAVDPQNSNVVYVTTKRNGTYKSTNAGANWTQINTINGQFVAFDVSGGLTGGVTKNIFIGSSTGVQRSTNGGTSFTLMSGSPTNVHRAAIHSAGTMYVTAQTGLFKWNGTAWSNISPDAGVECMGIDVNPGNANEVVVSEFYEGFGNSIFKSSNGGTNWTNLANNMTHDFTEIPFEPDEQFASSIFDFCWDPFTAGKVFFTDWYHVFQTDNINATAVNWKARAAGHEEIVTTGVLVAPPSGVNALLSCTADVGGFDHTSLSSPPARSLTGLLAYINCSGVAFPENNTNFIARVGSHGWGGDAMGGYSTNGGVSYTSFGNLPGSRGRIAMSANTETMIWTTQDGFTYRSTNRGTSWAKINSIPTGMIGGGNIFVYSNPLAADKINGNKFYIYNAGKMYVSTDGGLTFATAATNLPVVDNDVFFKVETSPLTQGDVWVAFDSDGLYHSTNSGGAFTKIANVQSAKLFSVGKALTTTPAIYVLGTVNNIADGVFRSDDNGANWTQINTSAYRMGMEPNSMAADRITYGRVFIGTNGNGIYVGDASSGSTVAVTGVTVSPASASVAAGSTQQLTATVAPSNASNQAITWSTSNAGVATVSSSGLVTGVAAGTATITVTTTDGGYTSASAITVTASTSTNIASTGTGNIWSQNTTAASNSNKVAAAGINDGNTTVDVKLNGSNDDNPNAYESAGVNWSTAQNNINKFEFINGACAGGGGNGAYTGGLVLQSSTDGTTWTNVSGWSLSPAYSYNSSAVTGVTYTFTGPALSGIKGMRITGQVRFTNADSWEESVREVRVWASSGSTVVVTGVTVSPASASVAAGSTQQLTATVAPSNASNQDVTWSTSNPGVATVSSIGLVTGVAAGTATITVTTTNGGYTSTSAITVTASTSTNIASTGTGNIWSQNTTAASNSNKVAAAGINDGNTTVDVKLNGSNDDNPNAYESAGVNWSTAQNNINKFEFINGACAGGGGNGAYTGGLVLQSSTDGTTWTNVSGWSLSPAYSYNSSAVTGVTYTFTGPALSGIKGMRITGQVRFTTADSWEESVREVKIYATSGGSMMMSAPMSTAYTVDKTVPPSNGPHVKVYPNPVDRDGMINLAVNDFTDSYNITIFNKNGRQVYTRKNVYGDSKVSPEYLKEAGFYIIIINEGKNTFTHKITVR